MSNIGKLQLKLDQTYRKVTTATESQENFIKSMDVRDLINAIQNRENIFHSLFSY